MLIVAGDLVPRAERGVRWLLDRVTDRPLIYVMGNHERYGTTWERRLRGSGLRLPECTCTLRRTKPSASAMSRSRARHSGRTSASTATRIAMMTAGDRMNDFKKIRISNYEPRFLPHHALTRHLIFVAFLDAEMRKPRGGDRLVLVMHHAPVRQMPPQRSVRRATSPSTPPTAAI
ncbi:metallophosphoesterase [Bradyrhizobium australiense]|uniref:Calcineurin-like phosphoesterase domain-containing protein n=1 Tax=Bradyrhizobium australiense TaxID=2721161 RepID=A0A7Y4GT16_9BRAD|nr:metallophosphoesterase [Bradyrhizobium australiense]NOJ41366.1 hypothetical protein [Bradyrhizobium australiense]